MIHLHKKNLNFLKIAKKDDLLLFEAERVVQVLFFKKIVVIRYAIVFIFEFEQCEAIECDRVERDERTAHSQ